MVAFVECQMADNDTFLALCAVAALMMTFTAVCTWRRKLANRSLLIVIPLLALPAIYVVYGREIFISEFWPVAALLIVAPLAQFTLAPLALAWNRHR